MRAKRALGLAPLTQGERRFTTPKPLRRIVIGAFLRGGDCLAAAWALSSHDDDAIEPLTSLSPLPFSLDVAHLRAQLRVCESRQDRFHRASVKRFGLIGPRCLPSMRTLHVFQSPLQRWSRDRRTPFWEMFRPLRGACHTTLGLGRSRSVLAPRSDSRRFFARECEPVCPFGYAGLHLTLGHRSLAPATFFEVRFAGLFEARRRLSTSATTLRRTSTPSSEGSSLDGGRNLLPTSRDGLSPKGERPRGASHAQLVMAAPAPLCLVRVSARD